MKKKKSKLIWVIIILFILLVGIVFMYFNQNSEATSSTTDTTTTNIKEVTVGTQTITKTLTSSGEIASNVTEELSLNIYRYFSEIYVEENDFVAEGDNILKYTNGKYLTAPYDLVVTKISVPDVGSKCTSAHSITVQSTEELTLTLNIDETEISSVKTGQEVEIVANAYEDKTYNGTITKINQIGSYASNGSSFTGTVVFENDGDLKIGMSASCTITLEKAENVIAVPIEAIQTQGSSKYIVVKNEDGSTTNVTVETGLSNDAYVEIKSGLQGGETIQMIQATSSSSSNKQYSRGQGEFTMGQGTKGNFEMPTGGMSGTGAMPGGNR